jgi:hypothetical protein
MALLLALTMFQHLIDGFRNRDLRQQVVDLLGVTLVFLDGRSIREAVNSGTRNMLDVWKLWNDAGPFKEWVKRQPDDGDLRDQFCRELMHMSWIEKLPPKLLRFVLFNSASATISLTTTQPAVALASGLALSAFDSLLLDRILKGWRPNQFVQERLRNSAGS